jgi:hypothetical protein
MGPTEVNSSVADIDTRMSRWSAVYEVQVLWQKRRSSPGQLALLVQKCSQTQAILHGDRGART